jgi:hypothetical protein
MAMWASDTTWIINDFAWDGHDFGRGIAELSSGMAVIIDLR